MKYILLTIGTFFVLFACQKPLKNIEDYTPTVEISLEVLDDGTVKARGKFLTDGAGQITKIGFNFSTKKENDLSENQILMDGNAQFEYVFTNYFHPDSTYYFKAFAVNNFGYDITEPIKLTGIDGKPVLAPCSLVLNRHYLGTFPTNIYAFDPSTHNSDYYEYSYRSDQMVPVVFRFNNPPKTGLYKTVNSLGDPLQGTKEVVIKGGWQEYPVSVNSDVYINRISVDSFSVEICNATMRVNNTDMEYKCRFARPY